MYPTNETMQLGLPEDSCSSTGSSLDKFFKEALNNPHLSKEEHMKYEWVRLASYSEFPMSSRARPMLLAEAGFYYSGHDETVVCFSCGFTHGTWSDADNPMAIHVRLSPDCKFVRGNEARNAPIRYQRNAASTSQFSSNFGLNRLPERPATPPIESNDVACSEGYISPEKKLEQNSIQSPVYNTMGVVFDKPKHPRYSVLSVRLSSFIGWPVYKSQTPKDLAMSGLFYAGFGDCVRCFYCGGGLRNWEAGDDPWVEHAKWFPNCSFLLQCKGQEFIRKVLEVVESEPEKSCDEKLPEAVSATTNVEVTSSAVLMSTPAVLSVLEMGYSRQRVKDIVETICEQNGQVTAENIMTKIFQHEEAEQKKKQTKAASASATNIGTEVPHEAANVEENEHRGKMKKSLAAEIEEMREQSLCKICMDEECCIVFLPCGHMVACTMCAPALRTCPICREFIKGTIRAYVT